MWILPADVENNETKDTPVQTWWAVKIDPVCHFVFIGILNSQWTVRALVKMTIETIIKINQQEKNTWR